MQAIITKYIAPTNTRGGRVKATCERGSLTVAWDHQLNIGENHRAACDALCAKFDREDAEAYGDDAKSSKFAWSRPKASGQLPSGEYVFCFIQERVLERKAVEIGRSESIYQAREALRSATQP